MKLVIFGATGGTGTQLLSQATAAGHEVTAVARGDVGRVSPQPSLRVVAADVMEPEAIAPVIAGHDAVVSALGHRGRGPSSVCADSAASIIAAMGTARVRRLVVVSASGAFIDEGDGPLARWVAKPLLGLMLRNAFADHVATESRVRASDLDWSIVRPPRLTDGERTGRYRTSVDRNVRGGYTISRADLADCLLRVLDDPGSVRVVTGVGY